MTGLSCGLLGLLVGLLLTSCAPPPRALPPALQPRITALAARLVHIPVDPGTGAPGATALLAAWRMRVATPAVLVPVHPIRVPTAPEEVSNVP
jgi:hypothetical protein